MRRGSRKGEETSLDVASPSARLAGGTVRVTDRVGRRFWQETARRPNADIWGPSLDRRPRHLNWQEEMNADEGVGCQDVLVRCRESEKGRTR